MIAPPGQSELTGHQGMSTTSAPHFLVKSINGVAVATFVNAKVVLEAREPLYDLVEKEGHKRIVLNFQNVRFISSAPIGVLINLTRKTAAVGGSVKFCCLDPDIVDIFRLTSVLQLFGIHDTEEDAIASF
jgi:anti-sigma B factor antagonist